MCPVEEACGAAVGDRHPFGAAGGAGGVDHVGQLVRARAGVDLGAGVGVLRRAGSVVEEEVPGARGQSLGEGLLGDHQVGTGVVEHRRDSFRRVGRVEGQEGAAGFEDAENRNHQLPRATGTEPDGILRRYAQVAEPLGQRPSFVPELAVGRLAAGVDHGDRFGRSGRLLEDEPVQAGGFEGGGVGSRAPLHEELGAFARPEQGQGGEGLVGIRHRGFEQDPEVTEEATDGGGVEEVGVVLEGEARAVAVVGREEHEIELGGAAFEGTRLELQARELEVGATRAESKG